MLEAFLFGRVPGGEYCTCVTLRKSRVNMVPCSGGPTPPSGISLCSTKQTGLVEAEFSCLLSKYFFSCLLGADLILIASEDEI